MTSANVVGYQNVQGRSGFSYITPTFEKVDGSAPTFGDIVPVGDSVGWGGEMIQTFDETDAFIALYSYYCADAGMAEGAGWYDAEGNCVNALPIGGKGKAMLFDSQEATIQFAGAVHAGTLTIDELNTGFTYVGNATPNILTIQDFKPIGDAVGWGGEMIQTFGTTAEFLALYTYYCADAGMAEGEGWYDAEGAKATLPVPAGTGFIFDSQGDCTIELPSVLD